MTCIVGIEHGAGVTIGGDSAGISGSDLVHRLDPKVFRIDKMVFGFTGSFRMGQILQHRFIPPENLIKDDFRFLCTTFVDSIAEALDNNGYGVIDRGRKEGGQFLLGYNKKLYCIHTDYQVEKVSSGYLAIGSGAHYALGALHATKDSALYPTERVERALDAANYHCSEVQDPYLVLSL